MKVKDLVIYTSLFIGEKELASKLESNTSLTEREQERVDTLVRCYNLVNQEIASDYLPFLYTEKIDVNNSILNFSELEKTIIKVLREKEINGKPLYDTKIRRTLSNIFDNSDRFKNIINLVYEIQDRKYTKEEIKVQYMNLIYVVITRIYNGEFQEYVEE